MFVDEIQLPSVNPRCKSPSSTSVVGVLRVMRHQPLLFKVGLGDEYRQQTYPERAADEIRKPSRSSGSEQQHGTVHGVANPEAVCKHILETSGTHYDDKDDLPKLYKQTAEQLNVAPSQHTEQVFKQILGGCTAVVEGLGSLRNRLSDAHGKGKAGAKPAARHAELAVNLSGALAIFLLATWEASQK